MSRHAHPSVGPARTRPRPPARGRAPDRVGRPGQRPRSRRPARQRRSPARATRRGSCGPSTASRTSSPKNFGSLGFGRGYAAAETSTCNLADTLVTGRGERSRWFGPDGALRRPGHAERHQPPGRRPRHRPPQPPGRREAARRPEARARARRPARWCAATPPASTVARATSAADGVTDPACRGAGYIAHRRRPPLDIWYGVYLANLLASTGRLRQGDRRRRPAVARATPGCPELPGRRRRSTATRCWPAWARTRAAVRLQRHRRRRRRDHDRPRHAARQPALPVARPLPLHPAAPDDPRQVRRRRAPA